MRAYVYIREHFHLPSHESLLSTGPPKSARIRQPKSGRPLGTLCRLSRPPNPRAASSFKDREAVYQGQNQEYRSLGGACKGPYTPPVRRTGPAQWLDLEKRGGKKKGKWVVLHLTDSKQIHQTSLEISLLLKVMGKRVSSLIKMLSNSEVSAGIRAARIFVAAIM